MTIDIARLRSDLMSYYGTAMFSASPMAVMELSQARNADADELIRMAGEAGLDLRSYIIY